MNSSTSKPAPLMLRLLDALTKWRPVFRNPVPLGYEDENGFHYGAKPAERKLSWPPAD